MKQNRLIQNIILLIGCLLLNSCSQNEEYMQTVQQNHLLIDIKDSGIYSNEPISRANTVGYTTTFSEGDKIGLYAVKNGEILPDVNNVCLSYTEGKWVANSSISYSEDKVGAIYYAYYPYDQALSTFNKTSTDPFEALVSSWEIGNDLTGDIYTGKDLMTGFANAKLEGRNYTLDLTLGHRMSLAVIKLPTTTYNFTNARMSSYNVSPQNISFTIGKDSESEAPILPYYDITSDTYRILIHPNTAYTLKGKFTNGANANKSYTINIGTDIDKAQYAQYIVDQPEIINYTLNIGDYYCADGSLVSKDGPAPSNCIGVVYQVGTTDAIKNDYPSCNHGLVYALKRVEGDPIKWSASKPSSTNWYEKYGMLLYNATGVDIQGYEETKTWMDIETGEVEGVDINSIMKSTLNDYRQNFILPSTTTDWYLPSYKELDALNNNATILNTQFSKVNGEALWTSATKDISYWSTTIRRQDAVVQYHPDNKTKAGYIRDSSGYYRYSFGF
ncbi:fimbrillin family protein [Bacteroides finegoldii]|uniref:fimbrillin family protein n=1 Tax=Bacteroides finegoldii TaxID=338188 RepID=UPI0018985DFB|nr:fimbrillin family protein [Bacteroides finegoldii]